MKYLDAVNLLLVIAVLVQLYQPAPNVLPLLQEDAPPRQLHAPQAAEHTLRQRLISVGPYVNVEDIIRHLEENPAEFSNHSALQKQLKNMQKTQQELLQTEEQLLAVEAQLNQLAIQMYQQLTPQQQRQLTNQRNLDSVQQIEATYWNDLIEQLEQQ